MPNRSYSATKSYRYGCNGKENDNEVKGEGNEQDYGMRIYDTRLGSFLSVDPRARSFSRNSPFSYAEGDPINFTDLDGAETPTTPAAAIPRPSMPGIGIETDRELILRTRPYFTNAPVSSYNPAPVPPNAGASRVPGGWDITTPNGSYRQRDYVPNRPEITRFQREEARRQAEVTEVRKFI